jgi:hypothetical protein
MKKITFICQDDDEAEMFIADSETTPGIIAYLDEGGGDHELQIQDLKMEDVNGTNDV